MYFPYSIHGISKVRLNGSTGKEIAPDIWVYNIFDTTHRVVIFGERYVEQKQRYERGLLLGIYRKRRRTRWRAYWSPRICLWMTRFLILLFLCSLLYWLLP